MYYRYVTNDRPDFSLFASGSVIVGVYALFIYYVNYVKLYWSGRFVCIVRMRGSELVGIGSG